MAFEALKERQSIAWSSAPYERVSEQHLSVIEALLGFPLRRERTLLVVADLADAGRIDQEFGYVREIDPIIAVLLRNQPRLFCKEGRTADFQQANTFFRLQ